MALSIGEAIAVQTVVDWLSDLVMHERHDNPDSLPGEDDDRLIGAVTLLSDAAWKKLGAGRSGAQAAADVREVLAVTEARP